LETLYDVLDTLIRHFLPDISNEEVFRIIRRRIDVKVPNLEELQDIDEVMVVLSPDDQEKLKTQQKKYKDREDEIKELENEYIKRRGSRYTPPLENGQAGRRGNHGPRASCVRLRTSPYGSVEQSEVKGFMPPDAAIWKDPKKGKWHVHLKGNPCWHVKFRDHGESGAAWEACKRAWDEYCRDHGVMRSSIPVEGLFDAYAGG